MDGKLESCLELLSVQRLKVISASIYMLSLFLFCSAKCVDVISIGIEEQKRKQKEESERL